MFARAKGKRVRQLQCRLEEKILNGGERRDECNKLVAI